MVTFDAAMPGTPEQDWLADPRLHDRPELRLDEVDELVVVAAHPDDETLGAGGLIARCAERGIPVRVILVTDGAASHPGDPRIVERRAAEAEAAIHALAPHAALTALGFADGSTIEQRTGITSALRPLLDAASPRALLAAPWRGDGHRDHRVVGEIVAELAGARTLLEYPVWMWHWASPEHPDTPWQQLVGVPVDSEVKARALAHYRSQTEGERPVLRGEMLAHFGRNRELFVRGRTALGRDYFDALYARSSDPWRFGTRWYEQRKRQLTLASLPHERYRRALEIGCSIGLLTELLAARCDELLAVDIAEDAVLQARARLGAAATVRRQDVREQYPEGPFDLVVVSEVGYYWTADELDHLLGAIRASLAPGGVVVACHWRHPVAEYPLSGDAVHEAIARLGWSRLAWHTEEDFLLEVFSDDARSVAHREGLA